MKFSVDREALCGALQAIGGGIGTNVSLPILNNVLLEAADGELALTASNLDFAMRCALAAAAERTGSATLPLKKLASVCRAIGAAALDFELLPAGNSVRVAGGGSLFRLASLPAADFPAIVQVDGAESVTLPAAEFATLLRRVDYAQSKDEHRQILNGVFFQLADGALTLVATDGRRLARSCRPDCAGSGSFILPARSGAELARLLPGAAAVAVSFGGRQVAFDVSYGAGAGLRRAQLVSKVVEGSYPNYRQVIPATPECRICVLRETFLGALQRAALVSSGSAPSIRIKFSENLIELFAASSEFGDAYERVAAVAPAQAEVEICFNPRYLIEPLRALDAADVHFEFRDGLSPGVLRSGENFLCVVMPLRSAG
jgi:DNA polymerase-3 subunit beta